MAGSPGGAGQGKEYKEPRGRTGGLGGHRGRKNGLTTRKWRENVGDEASWEALTNFLPMFYKYAVDLGNPDLKDVRRLKLEGLKGVTKYAC